MRKVMLKAWEIAKKAAAKFGGKAVEYIAGSLKMAWKVVSNEAGHVIINLKAQSNNNKNRKSWVARFYSPNGIKIEREFLDTHSDFDAEYKEYELQDGFYIVCDLGKEKFVKVENSEMKEVLFSEIKKELATELTYIEISEGSRNHKSYIAEIIGKDERWGFKREFISREHDELRAKYAFLEEGKVYEIQDGGDREYAIIQGGEIKYIAKEDVLTVLEEQKEVAIELLRKRFVKYLEDDFKEREEILRSKGQVKNLKHYIEIAFKELEKNPEKIEEFLEGRGY